MEKRFLRFDELINTHPHPSLEGISKIVALFYDP